MDSIAALQAWLAENKKPAAVFLFLFGSLVGSFLNVVIHRLPREESIVRPRSRCPACGETIRWYDNIPILSFLLLWARCRHCRARISFRYPLVEALTGGLLVALFYEFGPTRLVPIFFAFGAALIAISFIDLDHLIVPNEISIPGTLVGLGCSFLIAPGFFVEALIGYALARGLFLLVRLVYLVVRGRPGMGMGDVKLIAMIGAFLGWRSLLFVFLLSSVQSVLVALGMWITGAKFKPYLPEDEPEEEPAGPPSQGPRRALERGLGWLLELLFGDLGTEPKPEPASAGTPAAGDAAGDTPTNAQEEPVDFMSAALPFGPFLSLAAIEYLFFGEQFMRWVLGG